MLHPEYAVWLTDFATVIGGWPEHHISVDTETTGFSGSDRIWELGYSLVLHSDVVAYGDTQLKLSTDPHVVSYQLANAFERTKSSLYNKGIQWAVDWQWLEANGQSVCQAYFDFYELLTEANRHGCYVVGHNVVKFDFPRIQEQFRIHMGLQRPAWDLDRVIDLEAVLVGMQLGSPLPTAGLAAWYEMMKHTGRRGVKSNAEYCSILLDVACDGIEHRAGSDSLQCSRTMLKIHEYIKEVEYYRGQTVV